MTPSEAVRTWPNLQFCHIVDYLADHTDRWVQSFEIATYLYASDPDGGPDWAHSCVHRAVARGRSKLERAGWRIIGRRKVGYRLERA